MIRLLLKVGLIFTVLLMLPMLLIHARPAEDSELPAFLEAPADCAAPCLMGIQPGVTTMSEAVDVLRFHPWVATLKLEDYQRDLRGFRANGWLSWTWSDTHPDAVDTSRPGRVYFAQADPHEDAILVQGISIPTRWSTYLVQQWFGPPASGMVGVEAGKRLNYLVMYPPGALHGWIRVSTVLDCPATLMDYWNSEAEIMLTTAPITGDYVPYDQMVRMC